MVLAPVLAPAEPDWDRSRYVCTSRTALETDPAASSPSPLLFVLFRYAAAPGPSTAWAPGTLVHARSRRALVLADAAVRSDEPVSAAWSQ